MMDDKIDMDQEDHKDDGNQNESIDSNSTDGDSNDPNPLDEDDFDDLIADSSSTKGEDEDNKPPPSTDDNSTKEGDEKHKGDFIQGDKFEFDFSKKEEAFNFFIGSQDGVKPPFTIKDLNYYNSIPVISSPFMEHLNTLAFEGVQPLEGSRFLIIYGDHGSQYNSVATLAAKLIKTQDSKITSFFSSDVISKERTINLLKFFRNTKGLENSIVFLKDFLSFGNSDLQNFIQALDKVNAANLNKILKQRNIFLIFSTNINYYSGKDQKETTCHFKVPAIPKKVIKVYLFEKLNAELEISNQELIERRKDSLLKQLEIVVDDILSRLSGQDEVDRLIVKLMKCLKEEQTVINQELLINLASATDDLNRWFTDSLNEEPKLRIWSWSFVLSQVSPQNEGVKFSLFTWLDTILSKFILDSKILALPEEENHQIKPERYYREKTRAEIKLDKAAGEKIMVFREPNYAGRLWNVLLEEYPKQLKQISSFFLANVGGMNNIEHRVFLCNILGRLLENDTSLLKDTILKWASDDSWMSKTNVGYLYPGILASKKPSYIEMYEQLMANFLSNSKLSLKLTAISSYKVIGLFKTNLACRYILEVYKNEFKVFWGERKDFLPLVKNYELEVRKRIGFSYNVDNVRKTFTSFFYFLFIDKKKIDYYNALKFTLSALSINLNFLDFVESLLKELNQDRYFEKNAVSFLFLSANGIFDIVENHKVKITDPEGEDSQIVSILIFDMVVQEEKISSLSNLIIFLFNALKELPSRIRQIMIKSLLQKIGDWIESSKQYPASEAVMASFLYNLLNSQELKERLNNHLKSREHKSVQITKIRGKVRRRMLIESM